MQSKESSRSTRRAFVHGSTVELTMFYMGSLMTTLASAAETNGGFSLLEYRSLPGREPPPHIHINQDELLYVLEGEIETYCVDAVFKVVSGQSIFLPRNEAHAWYVNSEELRMLILTQPAGLDDYFKAMSTPATSMELPTKHITYAMDDPARAIRIGNKHGVRILTPDEAKELLPQYPGFGATVEERAEFAKKRSGVDMYSPRRR